MAQNLKHFLSLHLNFYHDLFWNYIFIFLNIMLDHTRIKMWLWKIFPNKNSVWNISLVRETWVWVVKTNMWPQVNCGNNPLLITSKIVCSFFLYLATFYVQQPGCCGSNIIFFVFCPLQTIIPCVKCKWAAVTEEHTSLQTRSTRKVPERNRNWSTSSNKPQQLMQLQ